MLRKLSSLFFFFIAGSLILLWVSRGMVLNTAKGYTYTRVDDLPVNHAGLVLGCNPRLRDGRANRYFDYRMQAAAELFERGKVSVLIVSGDNATKEYDEPSDMKAALVERGVPEERIFCDYAGFRTLDSVVRVREIFSQDSITIVSQRFHNERAVFIARRKGIAAVGYNAPDVGGKAGLKTQLREWLARTNAVLDLYVFRRAPRFGGEKVNIG